MSKKLGTVRAVHGRSSHYWRYHESRFSNETNARVYVLEWQAAGVVWQIDLDAEKHMTGEFDREHYGGFVMPCETELNIEDYERQSNWDPFIGPRSFNGVYSE